jgi:hypothetical protein
MNNEDFVLRHIGDLTGLPLQSISDNTQQSPLGEDPYQVVEEGNRWMPWETSVDNTVATIVSSEQQKAQLKAQAEERTRIAQAVKDALAPDVEVGKITPSGKIKGVPLAPSTVPETKESIRAGIKAVGVGGRQGVFSELPFDAEDVPDGWDVFEGNGGWWTTPKENTEKVVELEKSGQRHTALGYPAPKSPEDNQVIRVRDAEGNVVQDVTANPNTVSQVIEQAISVASFLGGDVERTTPQEALEQRTASTTAEKPVALKEHKFDERHILGSITRLTAEEEHPEGYVSPMTRRDDGTIGSAPANRNGMAYPYMFHVKGKGWEVDRGYGELIASGLSEDNARMLVQHTKPVPLEEAQSKMRKHLASDLAKVKQVYPSLSPRQQGVLAMMRYQGGDGLDVSKWNNTDKAIRMAVKSGKASDWQAVQDHMLNSKWAKYQTPERALRTVHSMYPSTPLTYLRDRLKHYQSSSVAKAQPTQGRGS